MPFVITAPDADNAGLSDIAQIRENFLQLRKCEAGTAPPDQGLTAGLLYLNTSTTPKTLMQYDGTNWKIIYYLSDSAVDGYQCTPNVHQNTLITNLSKVHGIKQGTGNNFDSDKLDGIHASALALYSKVGHIYYNSYDGTAVLMAADAERIVEETSPQKVKEFYLGKVPGTTLRFSVWLKKQYTGGNGVQGYVAINDVMVGGYFSTSSTAYVIITQDISASFVDGCRVQFHLRTLTGGNDAYCAYFRILYKPINYIVQN